MARRTGRDGTSGHTRVGGAMARRSGTRKPSKKETIPGRRSARGEREREPERRAPERTAPQRTVEGPPTGRAGLGAGAAHATFYAGLLRFLKRTQVRFMVGGTCALNVYVARDRDTKDLDIFCRPGDYPRLLKACADAGYRTEVEDERWIAKVWRGRLYCDVIFGSANAVAPVTDEWFRERFVARIFGIPVHLLAPTELVWSKAFIMDRYKFDGNDIAHILLRMRHAIDWKRLMHHFDQHWEVLLMHVLRFRYIYPSERDSVPVWLMDELLARLADQRRLRASHKRVCRGRLFSRDDFEIDITQWGFADVVGDHKPKDA
jgi:hypothetical protein